MKKEMQKELADGVEQGKRSIQQKADKGGKKIKFATDEGVRQIDEAKKASPPRYKRRLRSYHPDLR